MNVEKDVSLSASYRHILYIGISASYSRIDFMHVPYRGPQAAAAVSGYH